jgi:hypothetical protein
MVAFTVPGAAIPGLAVPGETDPGLPASFTVPPVTTWQFTGTEQLFYLQYLGPDGHTLSPLPGQAYTAGTITLVSLPYPMLDPPADGRWVAY